ncbi:Glycine/sarcosine/betaine reductase complex protein B alpha and beta subunits [Natranaerobius thermophilus JW/NM-WN-LF]|uniref:Glycine/sarcosine/betaine reductase complex protein B alpha and beta subunits n=1 Tax=Natranaerobius thermophilus (strain ATCC BAA-1301 / DSM 18059 / JW/NM-WN-LF) TaxID=457570 RepID=B2A2P8_NATTJ|nr:glycine/sarcosine/betaine reductase component B subunit [Natranaerobius thermophilus]ACB86266.1 Glycine/sarcosine/betaine reductase complex protein B alpha and beta subunits [Natranaerobius thermophilus JW/NM-WN-LF]
MNRHLEIQGFQISELNLNSHGRTEIQGNKLLVNSNITQEVAAKYPELKDIKMRVFTSKDEDIEVNTMMDVIPVKTKMEDKMGTGTTLELNGITVLLTGREASGKQVAEFGSTAGKVSEKIAFNMPGCPDEEDLILNLDMIIEDGIAMTRDGPTACHRAADEIIQEIRNAIKRDINNTPPHTTTTVTEGDTPSHQDKPEVVLVKEMMGQGGMHDNLLLPLEPCGVTGGKSVVDLGNVPVLMSPNEVKDGGIHAMTCVGPSTKETTRHYSRDPLLHKLYEDTDLYFSGVLAVGSPQSNHEKEYVAERVGMAMEKLQPDGVIVMTEGFGNNHIDFAKHIEEVGKRGFPVVGVTYAAKQGALIIGNEFMDAMVELNKSDSMFETEVLAENTLTDWDADRAVTMLKNKLTNNTELINSEVPVPQQPPAVWTEAPKDLSNTKVALVSAAGIHLKDQEPFNKAGDNTYRKIPWDVSSENLMVTHGGYDHKDVRQDINCMFPIDRLNELADEGMIKGGSASHIGFMGGGGDFDAFNDSVGPEIAQQLKEAEAGAAIFTAG